MIVFQMEDGKKIRTTGYAMSCRVGHLVRAMKGEVRLTWRSGSGRQDEEKMVVKCHSFYTHQSR
jgi:hypothetical protein